MLNDTKNDLIVCARKLAQPYESYSIDDLANAYCDAVDTQNAPLKDIYISALILRFWFTIDKMYKSNTVAPSLEREDFFWWLYEAIEYACKYRGWRDPEKNLNAQQCINKCITTIQLQKYYNLRLDKRKVANYCCSMDDPVSMGDNSDSAQTIADLLESEESVDDHSADDVMRLVQSYINRNKIIEAIIIDSIAFNDVQKHFKKTIKTTNQSGEQVRYVEHSSEFWPYKLVQIVSKLPETYKSEFMRKYNIAEEKLSAVLEVLSSVNNQKIYRYLRDCLSELRATYSY
jgi:hypothetical protein